MITVNILEDNDLIDPEDWCRPLALVATDNGYGDGYSFSSPYTKTPINNLKWVKVKHILGKYWYGKTIKQFNGDGYSKAWSHVETRMEFMQGSPPASHQLDMDGYNNIKKEKGGG